MRNGIVFNRNILKFISELLIINNSKPIEFDIWSNIDEDSISEILLSLFGKLLSIFNPSIISSLIFGSLWNKGKKLDSTLSKETIVSDLKSTRLTDLRTIFPLIAKDASDILKLISLLFNSYSLISSISLSVK